MFWKWQIDSFTFETITSKSLVPADEYILPDKDSVQKHKGTNTIINIHTNV